MQIKLRRDTTDGIERSQYIAQLGEMFVNTSSMEVFIGDGKTKAGLLKPIGTLPEYAHAYYRK